MVNKGKLFYQVYCALWSAVFFWSSAFVGIRIGLISYGPGALALMRFLIASVCMLIIYHRLPYSERISIYDKCYLLLLGVAGIGVYNLCLNYGEVNVEAGVASFIIGLMPVLTIFLSVLVLKERPHHKVYLGIILSFLGLYLIAFAGNHSSKLNWSMLMITGAAWMGALFTVAQKHFLQRYHPVVVVSWAIWGGTLFLLYYLPELWINLPKAALVPTAAVIYLGIFPAALAYVAWSYLLHAMPASHASMYLYAMPLISSALGFIFLAELPTVYSLSGGLLTLCGAYVATHYRSQPTK